MSISRTIHGGDKLAPRPMWKESLLYNSNYAVLDRCYDQAIGIWDLLPDHLSSLRSKYKMTYLNMYFNSGKPWISSLTEIVEKIRLDHFESNKVFFNLLIFSVLINKFLFKTTKSAVKYFFSNDI